MIEHEANSSFITPQVAELVKVKCNEASEKASDKVHHLVMAKSHWKKIFQMYGETQGFKESDFEFVALPVTLDRTVPESEIRFATKAGDIVGKIVGLER